jgi:hypothetical protein
MCAVDFDQDNTFYGGPLVSPPPNSHQGPRQEFLVETLRLTLCVMALFTIIIPGFNTGQSDEVS